MQKYTIIIDEETARILQALLNAEADDIAVKASFVRDGEEASSFYANRMNAVKRQLKWLADRERM